MVVFSVHIHDHDKDDQSSWIMVGEKNGLVEY